MKLLSLACFAVGALAQGISISSPPEGLPIYPGQHLTVQVVRANHIMSAIESSLVIGLVPCPTGQNCPSPTSVVGTILYNGPFNPQVNGPGGQYENFTVQVPPTFSHGLAQFQVVRFFFIGAGPSATIGDAMRVVRIR